MVVSIINGTGTLLYKQPKKDRQFSKGVEIIKEIKMWRESMSVDCTINKQDGYVQSIVFNDRYIYGDMFNGKVYYVGQAEEFFKTCEKHTRLESVHLIVENFEQAFNLLYFLTYNGDSVLETQYNKFKVIIEVRNKSEFLPDFSSDYSVYSCFNYPRNEFAILKVKAVEEYEDDWCDLESENYYTYLKDAIEIPNVMQEDRENFAGKVEEFLKDCGDEVDYVKFTFDSASMARFILHRIRNIKFNSTARIKFNFFDSQDKNATALSICDKMFEGE